ncbi:Ubiquitin-like protein [Kalmusia sp. IMI 367209]|nr:Ubiquitin-like protein [Kalmusia sp. IMI 367209]
MLESRYQYTPLDYQRREIRLITLYPEFTKARPQIKIRIASLDDEPHYEALSYTWGDPTMTRAALVESSGAKDDGIKPSFDSIGITSNVAEALEYLRLPDQERVLWIDGICIDQKDISEREEQVKLMSDIYEGAYRVLVWLGPGDEDTSHALDLYDTVSRNLIMDWITAGCEFNYTHDLTEAERDFLQCDSIKWEPHMRCLYKLWQRPWFGRVWIRQEILRGPRGVLFCGNRGIPWEAFAPAHAFIFKKAFQVPGPPFPDEVERARNIIRDLSTPQIWNLPIALRIASKFGCADSRDKVYGSFGMFASSARRALIAGIPVNYSKPVLDVYRDSALYIVDKCGRLDFLKDCGGVEREAGRPSWIPHWDIPIEKQRLHTIAPSTFSRTDAVWTGPGCDRLKLSVVLSTKIQAGHLPDFYHKLPGERRIHLALLFQAIAAELNEAGDEDPLESITHVFTHGNSSHYVDEYPFKVYSANSARSCVAGLIDSHGLTPVYQDWSYFITVANRSCKEQRIIQTESGLLGLAPRASLDGDVIAIMPGCDVPIVLRPQEDGAFSVLGECYVYELSCGEALLGPLDPSWRMHPIRIDGTDKQQWEFSPLRKWGSVALTPDPRLDWTKLETGEKDAELQFTVIDEEGNKSRTYGNRPDVEYFRAAGIPLQVIELV